MDENAQKGYTDQKNTRRIVMEEKKGKILKGQFPVSIFYILFGLCLALMPVETVNVLCKVIFGLVLIGAGLYHIFLFVMEKGNATVLDLFSGVIVLVIGAFLFMNPQVVIKLLTLMLGAFILVDSIWMLRGSLKLKKRGIRVWKAFLLAGLLFIGLGIMLLVNPFSELKLTMQVAGWIFVGNGGLDIIFYFIYKHGMKKEIPVKETENQEKEKLEQEKESAKEPEKEPDMEADLQRETELDTVADSDLAGKSAEVSDTEQSLGKKAEEVLEEWKD